MRKVCIDMVYELAQRDPRVLFIGSDLGAGILDAMKREMPERFFMEGVSEANLVGMAAGLALEGKIPYINTIATFLTRRCFEQVVLDLGLHQANVRMLGNGGGLVYAPLGPTHLATDDIAICRAVPGLAVLVPADAVEMRHAMLATLDHKGPIYVRMAKGGDRVVTPEDRPFAIGRGVAVREGRDALLVTTGVTQQVALDALPELAAAGIDAGILHLPTVKPFDADALLALAADVPIVVSIEEHTIVGGLGSAVAETLAEAGFDPGKRFKRIGIPDVFPNEYGSQNNLMELYGITTGGVVSTVQSLTR